MNEKHYRHTISNVNKNYKSNISNFTSVKRSVQVPPWWWVTWTTNTTGSWFSMLSLLNDKSKHCRLIIKDRHFSYLNRDTLLRRIGWEHCIKGLTIPTPELMSVKLNKRANCHRLARIEEIIVVFLRDQTFFIASFFAYYNLSVNSKLQLAVVSIVMIK